MQRAMRKSTMICSRAMLCCCADGSIRLIDLAWLNPSKRPAIPFAQHTARHGDDGVRFPGTNPAQTRPDERGHLRPWRILYKMLTGAVPFSGDDPFAIQECAVDG